MCMRVPCWGIHACTHAYIYLKRITFILCIYNETNADVSIDGLNYLCRRNWLSVKFAWQDTFEAQRAASLPRYYRPGNVSLPEIFVVSLKTASDRRECVQQQMTEQKIPFKWWDAVDGTQHMPEDEIRWHLSGSRLKSYFKSPQGSRDWRKAACDLSHLRLMHDMIASGRDVQVVLEDDVQLVTDFEARLKAALAALPADWDVLWLNHGRPIQRNPNNLSGWVGPGLRLFRDNSGTVGMVYRRSFAFVVSMAYP